MKVLVACEESQAVTIEFRKLGIEAYSCDIQECSGGFFGNYEWHIKDDVLEWLNGFYLCDCGLKHSESSGKYGCCGISKFIEWDLLIAFPPCTNLAVSGARHFKDKIKNGSQKKSIEFFMKIVNSHVKHVAIENPIGIMSSIYRKPDQIIQPYFFGNTERKSTCLWLKNLPKLEKTKIVEPKFSPGGLTLIHRNSNSKLRSKTFPGIAAAMAKQWSEYLINENQK